MNIYKVKLREVSIKEVDGEFKEIISNERVVPCVLTHYSEKMGRDLGLFKGSLRTNIIQEVMGNELSQGQIKNISAFDAEKMTDEQTNILLKVMDSLDMSKLMKVVYLGCLGANPAFGLDFDKFCQQIDITDDDLYTLYIQLISSEKKTAPLPRA